MGSLPIRRKGGQRRTRHPMPLPPVPSPEGQQWLAGRAEEHGAAVRRGPQAELCRRTACCVCWAIGLTLTLDLVAGPDGIYRPDWTKLPAGSSIAHHEPEGINGDDDDTIPLCERHHTGPLSVCRHPGGARRFWGTYRFDWTEVRDEMRRRTAEARMVACG